MNILIYILVGALSAIAALCTYILIRRIILKGQKEEIIRKAEIEAENIKKIFSFLMFSASISAFLMISSF